MATRPELEYQLNEQLRTNGKEITSLYNVLFTPYEEGVSSDDYSTMYAYNKVFNVGNTFGYEGNEWIVVHADMYITDVYSRYVVRKTNRVTNWIINEEVQSFDSIIDVQTQGIGTGDIPITEGKLTIRVPQNEYTTLIDVNDRVIVYHTAWKVYAMTNTVLGMIDLYVVKDSTLPDDDLINEIPSGLPKYTITINPIDELEIGTDRQLGVTVTKNGETVTNIPFTVVIDDTTKATINDDLIITPLAVGTINITATLTDKDISDTISVEVKEEPISIIYSIRMTPIVTGITKFDSNGKTFTLDKYANEEKLSDTMNITYAITQGDSVENTDYTVEITGNSVLLKNINESSATITFTATDNADLTESFNIRMTAW